MWINCKNGVVLNTDHVVFFQVVNELPNGTWIVRAKTVGGEKVVVETYNTDQEAKDKVTYTLKCLAAERMAKKH